MVPTVPPVGPPDTNSQLQFARHNFDNHQNLIRFADTKAAAFVTVMVFLGASSFPFAKDVVGKLRWQWYGGAFTSGVYVVSYLVFLLAFLAIVILTLEVIKPRGARHYRSPQAGRSLMFYEHILMHTSTDTYFDAVAAAPPDLILRNTTDQVFELAHICRDKMAALTRARTFLFIAFYSWLFNICTGLLIMRWK
jgi:hypothetical protein